MVCMGAGWGFAVCVEGRVDGLGSAIGGMGDARDMRLNCIQLNPTSPLNTPSQATHTCRSTCTPPTPPNYTPPTSTWTIHMNAHQILYL